MRLLSLFLAVTLVAASALGQDRRDRAVFVEPKNEFMDSMKVQTKAFHKKAEPAKRDLRMDFSTVQAPKSVAEFSAAWHNAPISQGFSGMCWCFSATSYFESEIYRQTKRQIKLSELYTVYHEYLEKARRYVKERGKSEFGQGSEANAVPRIWKQYGIVPAGAYSGLLPGQKVHDHDVLFEEMESYLKSVKNTGMWNEDAVLGTIRSILNHHLGEPPRSVTVNGKSMTPAEYLKNVVRLNLDDYVEVMSLMEKPYYEKVEYEVPDNWWHSKEYFNVPLNDFMAVVKEAVRKGHTVCIGGDVSEAGYEGHAGIGVVPTFDIPSSYIDENARQFRFSNKTTTDDHGIHIVGFTEKDGKDWYLIKDSGAGSRNNSHPGYYFYHEDFVKLKMMGVTVHRDVLQGVVKVTAK